MSGRVWTNNDIQSLRRMYPIKETAEIITSLNRSAYSIHQKSRELRLYKDEQFLFKKRSLVQKEYLKTHTPGRCGHKNSQAANKNISEAIKKSFQNGRIVWNKNLTRDELKKHYPLGWNTPVLKGRDNPMFGIKRYGKKNPNWKGEEGIHYDRIGFINKIKKRDEYTCQLCNKKGKCKNLHGHHIDFNNKNHDLLNGITLCCACHNSIKKNKEQNIIKLTKIVRDKYGFK